MKIRTQMTKAEQTELKTVHVQFFGLARAKRADEFAVGDVRLFTHGTPGTVAAVKLVSPKYLEMTITMKNGTFTKRIKRDVMLPVG